MHASACVCECVCVLKYLIVWKLQFFNVWRRFCVKFWAPRIRESISYKISLIRGPPIRETSDKRNHFFGPEGGPLKRGVLYFVSVRHGTYYALLPPHFIFKSHCSRLHVFLRCCFSTILTHSNNGIWKVWQAWKQGILPGSEYSPEKCCAYFKYLFRAQ